MGQNIHIKNQKKHERACEKISKVISVTNPTKIIRRISNPPQSHASPSNPETIAKNINIQTKHNPPDELVRVHFAETTTQMEKPKYKTQAFGKKTHNFLGHKAPPPPSPSSGTAKYRIRKLESKDDRFTDYINKAKLKIRAMTNLGDIMNTDETETENKTATATEISGKNRFSEYIKRAKMRIRATSSLGGGNRTYDSFKSTRD